MKNHKTTIRHQLRDHIWREAYQQLVESVNGTVEDQGYTTIYNTVRDITWIQLRNQLYDQLAEIKETKS
jgi:hypothetical protein